MRRAIPLLLCLSCVAVPALVGADTPASPFTQAGSPPASGDVNNLEFAGVSTVGKRTMINLYDKQQKRSFWVEAGHTSGDVTVVSYDNNHDQVTVRRNGAEKLLPLRPPSTVVNGAVAAVPVPAAAAPVAADSAPALAATTSTESLSQARQEEEARMLVSDLLEIGMAQRKAYEEKMRQAKAGGPNTAPPAPAPNPPATPATPGAQQPAAPAANTAAQP